VAKLLGLRAEEVKRIDLKHYQFGNVVYEVVNQSDINYRTISMSHFVKVDVGERKYAIRELSEKIIKKYGIEKISA